MGITVTAVAAAIVFGILFLQQPAVFATGLRVRLMIDHAASLARGDDVRFRGVRVGTVQSIDFVKSGLRVNLQIDSGVPIPSDSAFVVQTGGILGGDSVMIKPGSSSTLLSNNAQVQGQSRSGILSSLQSNSSLANQLQGAVSDLRKFPDVQIGKRIETLLASLTDTTKSLNGTIAGNKAAVGHILSNLAAISGNNRGQISDTVTAIRKDTEVLQSSLNRFDTALADTEALAGEIGSVVQDLNRGQGTAGKLLTNDELYSKLTTMVDNINALVVDVKQNPGRYFQLKIF